MFMRKRKVEGEKNGLTLVELLMTVFVLSVGILSSLLYFVSAISSSEFARDTTIATTHGEFIMEEMKIRPTLANITATNWATYASASGLNTLPSESITVTFTDANADPLNITTNVNWVRRNRDNTVSLTTEMTK